MSNELLNSFDLNSLGSFEGVFYLIAGVLLAIFLLWLIVTVSLWRIFTKAGKPGWPAIIPIYKNYVLVEVARLPVWYFIVLCIPTLLGIAQVKDIPEPLDAIIAFGFLIAYCIVVYNVAKQFGKGIGYTIGLVLLAPIFYPMLAFGDSVYRQGDTVENQDTPIVSTEVSPTLSVDSSPQVQEIPEVEIPPTQDVTQGNNDAQQESR